MKTCAFTGHRPKSVDMYAAEIVLALKEKYPQITLECAIPYERQAVRWPEALRNRYFSIAERNAADGLVCTEPPETGMAGISGYLGTLCHIKRSLSAPAEGLFLFWGCGHTSQSASLTAPLKGSLLFNFYASSGLQASASFSFWASASARSLPLVVK